MTLEELQRILDHLTATKGVLEALDFLCSLTGEVMSEELIAASLKTNRILVTHPKTLN